MTRLLLRTALPLVLLAGCGGGSSSTPVASGATATPGTSAATTDGGGSLTIKDFSFRPATLSVKVGAKVTVKNLDTSSHTWTAKDGSFDSKDLGTDQTFSFTFTKAGAFAFVCSFHPGMKGTVIVAP